MFGVGGIGKLFVFALGITCRLINNTSCPFKKISNKGDPEVLASNCQTAWDDWLQLTKNSLCSSNMYVWYGRNRKTLLFALGIACRLINNTSRKKLRFVIFHQSTESANPPWLQKPATHIVFSIYT